MVGMSRKCVFQQLIYEDQTVENDKQLTSVYLKT